MQRLARILVVLALTFGAGAGVQASDKDDEKLPKTRLEHFRSEMKKIRFQIINAGARIKGGSVSMGLRNGEAPDTPANRCCAVNVVGLEKHLTKLIPLWQDLNACYTTESNADAQTQLNVVRADAGSLVRAYENFRGASENHLLPAHQAMSRGFMLLEQSVDELDECGEKIVRSDP